MHSAGRIPRYPMRRCDGTDVKTAETALQRAVVQGVTALRLKMAGQRRVSFLEIKLNLRQVAELTGMPLRTVRYKAKTGQIPAECTLN